MGSVGWAGCWRCPGSCVSALLPRVLAVEVRFQRLLSQQEQEGAGWPVQPRPLGSALPSYPPTSRGTEPATAPLPGSTSPSATRGHHSQLCEGLGKVAVRRRCWDAPGKDEIRQLLPARAQWAMCRETDHGPRLLGQPELVNLQRAAGAALDPLIFLSPGLPLSAVLGPSRRVLRGWPGRRLPPRWVAAEPETPEVGRTD